MEMPSGILCIAIASASGIPTDADLALAKPLAMAGVSDDSPLMRQIGIDVLPQVRQRRLAARLVYELSRMVLADGYVPFYGTSPSHVLSQRVALAAGFIPTWWGVCLNEHARYAARCSIVRFVKFSARVREFQRAPAAP